MAYGNPYALMLQSPPIMAGSPFSGPQMPRGMLRGGNIDLYNRPIVRNADGSISTVKSMSFNNGDHEVLVPMVSPQGALMDPDQSRQQYFDTGQHLGVFSTPDDATMYARWLHMQQQDYYRDQQ